MSAKGTRLSLTIDEVTRIARDAARAASPSLRVAGVTLGGGSESEYVEILVNVDGCKVSPCQVEVGAFRNVGESALREEITRKLREHLADHT